MKKEMSYETYAYIFVVGVGSIFLSRIHPQLYTTGILISASGVGLSLLEYFSKHNTNMWKAIGLETKDGKVPICIKKQRLNIGCERIYSVPIGLSCRQIMAKKEEIENSFKCNTRIDLCEDFTVKITTLK